VAVPGSSLRGIFLSYRREDAAPYARLLKFQLSERFPDAQVFMDLDSIEAGLDFAEVITEAVDSSVVLVALIGRQWATLVDEQGQRRLDDPDDLVRFEVQMALEQGVRVIPVLVDGARPLRQQQLPSELSKLARFNALEVSYGRYDYDAGRLLDLIERVLAAAPGGGGPKRGGTREPWNGHDWYVSFGEYDRGRNWEDARKFGFVSAGGLPWYSKTLRSLPVGARIFTYIPQAGYVGVGTTTGGSSQFDDALVAIDGEQQKLSDQPLVGNYHHPPVGGEDTAEYVVPVEWITTRPRELAIHQKGLFANQNSACKLRSRFTLNTLYSEFGLEDAET
jgi:TIR domain